MGADVNSFVDKIISDAEKRVRTDLKNVSSKIKQDFRRKNIKVICDNLNQEKVRSIKGVIDITKNKDEYNIKIEDNKYVNDVFNIISKFDNVTKFVVEEPTLNEIFVSTVGEAYEK